MSTSWASVWLWFDVSDIRIGLCTWIHEQGSHLLCCHSRSLLWLLGRHIGAYGCYNNLGLGTWTSAQSECAGVGGHILALELLEEFDAINGNSLISQTHYSSDKYSTMQHFVTEMCTRVPISIIKRNIVGYGTGEFWDWCYRLLMGRLMLCIDGRVELRAWSNKSCLIPYMFMFLNCVDIFCYSSTMGWRM